MELSQLLPPAAPASTWVQTHTGKAFNPLDPQIEDIDIEDIAQGLSNLCRFNGQCRTFYSVAQHCVLVASHCSPEHKLQALLHDAPEAYLSDVVRPIKYTAAFDEYRRIERRLQGIIYRHFGLSPLEAAEVKDHDLRCLATEQRDLMQVQMDWKLGVRPYEKRITPWSPVKSRNMFMAAFNELTGDRPDLFTRVMFYYNLVF